MTKIVLGKRPKNFAPFDVAFVGPDGEDKIIPGVVFKYRTRSEFAKFTDQMNDGGTYQPEPGEKFSLEKMFDTMGRTQVTKLLQCIDSWGLDDIDLAEENLLALQDEMPAGALALWNAYGNACRDGRLGN